MIGAASWDGRVWCSSARPGTDISDHPDFRRTMETWNFAVGGYLVGRVTGRRRLNLSLRISDADGEIAGVLNAGVDLDLLAEDLAKREPTPGVTLTMADPGGIVLVDLPGGAHVGQPLPERLRQMLQAAQPRVNYTDGINGSRQIVGYVPAATYSSVLIL